MAAWQRDDRDVDFGKRVADNRRGWEGGGGDRCAVRSMERFGMSRNRWITRDSEGTVIPVWGAFNTLTDVDVISGP